MDRYTSLNSKASWSALVRDLQDTEEPSDRSLPEQKGPQPTAARGDQKRKLHQTTRTKKQKLKSDPKSQRGRGKERIYV